MSSNLTNTTEHKMLVTKIVTKFDWTGTKHWYVDCKIEIASGDTVDLPDVPFEIGLQATAGVHQYKPGIIYKLLKEGRWELCSGGISLGKKRICHYLIKR